MTARARDAIFLSHANPEDNAFTVWLGARLADAVGDVLVSAPIEGEPRLPFKFYI